MPTIMIIVAHHDDVEVHCGGTAAKYVQAGWRVIYTVVGNGPYYNPWPEEKTANHYRTTAETTELREQEAREGARILGVSDVRFLRFRSIVWYQEGTHRWMHLDGIRCTSADLAYVERNVPGREFLVQAAEVQEAVTFMAEFIAGYDPEIILTHIAGDGNYEHYAVAKLVRNAVRTLYVKGRKKIRMFGCECGGGPVNYCFAPTRFVDIAGTLEIKCRAVAVFKSQFPDHDTLPFVRRVRLLAGVYGKLAGLEYAEPFMEFNIMGRDTEHGLCFPKTYDPSKALKELTDPPDVVLGPCT